MLILKTNIMKIYIVKLLDETNSECSNYESITASEELAKELCSLWNKDDEVRAKNYHAEISSYELKTQGKNFYSFAIKLDSSSY